MKVNMTRGKLWYFVLISGTEPKKVFGVSNSGFCLHFETQYVEYFIDEAIFIGKL